MCTFVVLQFLNHQSKKRIAFRPSFFVSKLIIKLKINLIRFHKNSKVKLSYSDKVLCMVEPSVGLIPVKPMAKGLIVCKNRSSV
jgi:hypothetical protein